MNRKLCLLFLVCLAVVLVKSETSIEVDENGDEYEVKRFNIQGRQLNEGRSQCVITRRKRSSYASAMKPVQTEESDEDEDDGNVMAHAPLGDAMLFYSPPATGNGAEDDEDEDDVNNNNNGNDDDDLNVDEDTMNAMLNVKPGQLEMDENKGGQDEDDSNITSANEDDYEYGTNEDDAETIEVVQLPQLPVLGQLQSQGQSVAAIASSSSLGGNHGGYVSVSHHGHPAATNGIMVVESHSPPKVNPNTHAVFELVQVNPEDNDANGDDADDDDDDDVEGDFDIVEELEPVTTTAIWSTGADDDLYDDLDSKPIKPVKVNNVVKKKPNRRPTKINKKTTKRPLKPMRKNKKKKTNKNKRVKGNNKNRINKNKRRPNRNRVRPLKRRKNNKMRLGNKTRRPSRRIVKKTLPELEDIDNSEKKKTNRNNDNRNKNRHVSANKRDIAKKRKHKNNVLNKDQGENTFTRTVTMTQTDGSGADQEPNCIFIRKDAPPATTARPFWNIMGRSADGSSANASQFGKRKRANLRFRA